MSAATAAVINACGPNVVRKAPSTLASASLPLLSQARPQSFGYSQSTSTPSNTPDQRASWTSFWHDAANAAGSFAAAVKPPEPLQPPNDQITLRPGYFCFSLRSCPKLPRSGACSASAAPSTLSAAGI